MNSNNTRRDGADELETFVMENCLMLFKTQAAAAAAAAATVASGSLATDVGRNYTCKTCGKRFSSFQALGGHRASHKKSKSTTEADVASTLAIKVKPHVCSICSVEFPTGQALGGHMRRHRAVVGPGVSNLSSVTEISEGNSHGNVNKEKKRKNDDDKEVSILKKSNSSKRVCLDFNLSFGPWMVEKSEAIKAEKRVDDDVEDGEIVEFKDDNEDFLKLELRPPIRV